MNQTVECGESSPLAILLLGLCLTILPGPVLAGGLLLLQVGEALAPPVERLPLSRSSPDRGGPGRSRKVQLVLPGGHARFGFTLSRDGQGGASQVRVVEPAGMRDALGRLHEGFSVRAFFVQVWKQRDSHDHGVPLQDAAELLWRHGSEFTARPDGPGPLESGRVGRPLGLIPARAWVSLLVKVSVAPSVPPGSYREELKFECGGQVASVPLRVRVLEPLAEAPREPALVYVRGTLIAPGEDPDWPERVSEEQLSRDLKWLSELGFTHVTSFEASTSPRALRWEELALAAGFSSEITHLSWAPQGEPSVRLPQRLSELRSHEAERAQSFPAAGRELHSVWDEPEGAEVELARQRAMALRRAGALSTAAVQTVTTRLLAADLDLPMLDNYLSSREDFLSAVEASLAVGAEPWQYWQSWLESPRLMRWNAGFRQVDEPTRGQVVYAFAHVLGEAWDDRDGKDMLMAQPHDTGVLIPTLQSEAVQAGLEDLRLWRAGLQLVQRLREEGHDTPALRGLARELTRARRRWSADRNSSWGNVTWTDYVQAAAGRGPQTKELQVTRQRLLVALAGVQEERGPKARLGRRHAP